MSKTVTTRLPEEMVKRLEEISRGEHLNRSALIRKMLMEDVEEYNLKKVSRRYEKSQISIEEAAQEADVSLWELIEYLNRENISPPTQSLEELEEEFSELEY